MKPDLHAVFCVCSATAPNGGSCLPPQTESNPPYSCSLVFIRGFFSAWIRQSAGHQQVECPTYGLEIALFGLIRAVILTI